MRRPTSHPADVRARVARGDPAIGGRARAEMISAASARAEAVDATEVAGHLRMALSVAEGRAAERGGPAGRRPPRPRRSGRRARSCDGARGALRRPSGPRQTGAEVDSISGDERTWVQSMEAAQGNFMFGRLA